MTTRQTLAAAARRERERELVDATRALFDERGVQDAPIEEIARAVGINKALIYRHVASKDELFTLVVVNYLDDLRDRLAPLAAAGGPEQRLRAGVETFADFCLEFPAFLDCALSLMRGPADELRTRVSEGVFLQLGRAMGEVLAMTARTLAEGTEQGVFGVDDPALAANVLYTQTLGIMHLARSGVVVGEVVPGVSSAVAVAPQRVRDAAVDAALAQISRAARPRRAPAATPGA
jgi:AcrR family transcriptional regulator